MISDEFNFSHKKGLSVKVFGNNIDTAIAKLKRLCNNEGITKELRDRRHYDPPSVIKRRKHAEAVLRWRKKEDIINEVVRPKRKTKKDKFKESKPKTTPNQEKNSFTSY